MNSKLYALCCTDREKEKETTSRPLTSVLPTLNQLKSKGIDLISIINTHSHYDHAGGNVALLKTFAVPIIGGKDCPKVTTTPEDGSMFKLGENIQVTAIHTPCHTRDSICFYFHDTVSDQKAVFTGDTLFICGCGRFMQGTAEEMHHALKKLSQLPEDTRIYPGHEYTAGNLKFAKTVLNNEAIRKLDQFTSTHEKTTGEVTMGEEVQYNPFMRTGDPEIQKVLGLTDEYKVMQKLRDLKNAM